MQNIFLESPNTICQVVISEQRVLCLMSLDVNFRLFDATESCRGTISP